MLRHKYAISDTDSSARGSLFREICGEKRGWHLKPRYFPISSVLKKKMNFGNLKGAYKDSRAFFFKGKPQGKQRLEETEWKIKHGNGSKYRMPRSYSALSSCH